MAWNFKSHLKNQTTAAKASEIKVAIISGLPRILNIAIYKYPVTNSRRRTSSGQSYYATRECWGLELFRSIQDILHHALLKPLEQGGQTLTIWPSDVFVHAIHAQHQMVWNKADPREIEPACPASC